MPYERNPRINEKAIEPVARSLREFGFRQPLVVDTEGVLVVGHTRLLAAKSLGMTEVRFGDSRPVVRKAEMIDTLQQGDASPASAWLVETTPRDRGLPNLIVLTPGHTGSSIVTWMLHQLGWHASADVDHFAEPVVIRELNDRCLAEGTLDFEAARDELAKLPTPWAIKDPRLARTMQHWLPLLEPYAPALLYLSRDVGKVRASFERRGQRTDAVDDKVERCEAIFESWPWRRMEVNFDELSRMVGAFDPGRRGNEGHGVFE